MANAEKLRLVLERIEREVEEGTTGWDQSQWALSQTNPSKRETPEESCGTSFCFAGWAAVLDGARLFWNERIANSGAAVWVADEVLLPDGDVEFIWEYAQKLLELTDQEADVLFYGGNALGNLQAIVQDLIDGKGIDRWLT
jgi:hypothetical protein